MSWKQAERALGGDWLKRGQDRVIATRVGDIACTTGVPGIDFKTGVPPEAPEAQFAAAFETLAALLADVGLGLDDVALLNIHIPDRAQRAFINDPWLKAFPGPIRPARKTNQSPLPEGLVVQLQATAIVDGNRRTLEIPGLAHRDPLPMGFTAGGLVFSSVIGGDDPATGLMVEDPAGQIRCAFENVRRLMAAAGGDLAGVNHAWVFMSDMGDMREIVTRWTEMFPEDGNRPARKSVPYALPEGCRIQLQITGAIGAGRRNFEVPGVWHHDPIPLGSRAGGLLQSSGVHAIDPATSKIIATGPEDETRIGLRNLRSLIETAGARLDEVALVTVLLSDMKLASFVAAQAAEILSGLPGLPPLRFVYYRLPPGLNVQFHLTAFQADPSGH